MGGNVLIYVHSSLMGHNVSTPTMSQEGSVAPSAPVRGNPPGTPTSIYGWSRAIHDNIMCRSECENFISAFSVVFYVSGIDKWRDHFLDYLEIQYELTVNKFLRLCGEREGVVWFTCVIPHLGLCTGWQFFRKIFYVSVWVIHEANLQRGGKLKYDTGATFSSRCWTFCRSTNVFESDPKDRYTICSRWRTFH